MPLALDCVITGAWYTIFCSWLCREVAATLPQVEPLDVQISPEDTLLPVGLVSAIIGSIIVVQVCTCPKWASRTSHFSMSSFPAQAHCRPWLACM